MAKWNEGDRVRVVTRTVTEEDRKKNRYFEHMAGLVGTVQNVYGDDTIAVQVDKSSLSEVTADVHQTAMARMREKYLGQLSEEQRKQLTKEETEFEAHYVLLAQASDLEKE